MVPPCTTMAKPVVGDASLPPEDMLPGLRTDWSIVYLVSTVWLLLYSFPLSHVVGLSFISFCLWRKASSLPPTHGVAASFLCPHCNMHEHPLLPWPVCTWPSPQLKWGETSVLLPRRDVGWPLPGRNINHPGICCTKNKVSEEKKDKFFENTGFR